MYKKLVERDTYGWRLKSPRQNLPGRFPPAEIPPAIFPPTQNLPAIFPPAVFPPPFSPQVSKYGLNI